MKSLEKEILNKIAASKKYRSLYRKTIEHVVGQTRTEKEARNLLHQIWNVYWNKRPDFRKLLIKLKTEGVLPILEIHSSTKERLPILDSFYKKIFTLTGTPSSIIDHACGLNPLTISWMNLPEDTAYKAFDIDTEEVIFLNSALQELGIKKAKVNVGDILTDDFPYADIVFMLKLLPCLEHQKKGVSLEVLRRQKCKFLVVSFPIKSIGGSERGMEKFYEKQFLDLIKDENWQCHKLLFDTELVFIIKKG